MSHLSTLKIAAVSGFTGVMIGAMGAHALKPYLSEYQVLIFEKAVHYQFFHTLAILAVGIYQKLQPGGVALQWSVRLFLAGILAFSGSLYLLACKDIVPFSVLWAGPVTPLGGIAFMGGWFMLFWSVFKDR